MNVANLIIMVGSIAAAIAAVIALIGKVAKPFMDIKAELQVMRQNQDRDYARQKRMSRRQRAIMSGVLNIYRHIENGNEREKISASFHELTREIADIDDGDGEE
jgi:hypothetical protein